MPSREAEVDALGGHTGSAHHFQEFTASAADIEDVVASGEIRHVDFLAGLYVLFGAAEALGETAVIEFE